MMRFNVTDVLLGWKNCVVSPGAMLKLFQSIIALFVDWLMFRVWLLGAEITACPATTLPPLGLAATDDGFRTATLAIGTMAEVVLRTRPKTSNNLCVLIILSLLKLCRNAKKPAPIATDRNTTWFFDCSGQLNIGTEPALAKPNTDAC